MRLSQGTSYLPSTVAICTCVASLILAACGGDSQSQKNSLPPSEQQAGTVSQTPGRESGGLAIGSWGGNTITLTATPQGVTLVMDCAIAQVFQPIVADAQGEFSVPGQVRLEGGGPVETATFQGTVTGDQLAITVFYRSYQGQVENWQDELTLGHPGPKPPVCPLKR